MAYFVAKELGMRPLTILEDWTCEELLVAYGEYINAHTAEYVESIPKKEWAKHKPKPITWLDRWGVLFVSPEQLVELSSDRKKANEKAKNETDILEAAKILFQ